MAVYSVAPISSRVRPRAPDRPSTGGNRIRVVEVSRPARTAAPQEHVFGLLSRLDRTRYDPTVIALSQGNTVRKLQREGIRTIVIDEPDDAIATAIVAGHRRASRRTSCTTTCTAPRSSGRRRRLPSRRPATRGRMSSRRCTRAGCGRPRTARSCGA